MEKIILYHGSPNKEVTPKYGLGEARHDYGKGFYLTEDIELAKEWSVCRPDESNGWVHKYELDTDGLKIFDFQKESILCWLAELMKHRAAADSKRYRMLAQKFIEKYGVETAEYDVIKGWRANASYFYIAKSFVRDEIDVEILEELLSLGGLGIQYCIKSELAYTHLRELEDELISVEFNDFNIKYNQSSKMPPDKRRETRPSAFFISRSVKFARGFQFARRARHIPRRRVTEKRRKNFDHRNYSVRAYIRFASASAEVPPVCSAQLGGSVRRAAYSPRRQYLRGDRL